MLNGAVTYRFKLGEHFQIAPRVDVQQRGELYWHINNQDSQDAYTLTHFTLNISYKSWKVSGFMRNAFDVDYAVEYFAQEYSGGGADLRWPNPPRTFGASLEYRF